jgi:hypothetical protein
MTAIYILGMQRIHSERSLQRAQNILEFLELETYLYSFIIRLWPKNYYLVFRGRFNY